MVKGHLSPFSGWNLWRRWFCVGWMCDIRVGHILRWIAEFIFGFYLFIFAIFSLFTTRSWIWFMHCGKSCFSRTIQKPIIIFLTVAFLFTINQIFGKIGESGNFDFMNLTMSILVTNYGDENFQQIICWWHV